MGSFSIIYSPLQNLQTRLLLQQYGGWSELRRAGHYDIERGVTVLPGLSADRKDRLHSYAVRNYDLLWKNEKGRYRKAYESLREARKWATRRPNFIERMLEGWRARKAK